jgi:hypothetical protein
VNLDWLHVLILAALLIALGCFGYADTESKLYRSAFQKSVLVCDNGG